MRLFYLIFILGLPLAGAAEWHASPDADYETIVEEAREDTRNSRFEEALQKYEWLQSYALGPKSFPFSMHVEDAIHGWERLGRRYPPAMDSFTNARSRLENKLTNGDDNSYKIFLYLATINEALGNEGRTAELFAALDKNHPSIASSVFRRNYHTLVSQGDYKICGKYISPKKTCERLVEGHKYFLDKLGNDTTRRGMEVLRGNRNGTVEHASSLIAILVINDRLQEAKEIAEYLREELGTDWGKEIIDDALKGILPPHYRRRSEVQKLNNEEPTSVE